jgi:hypothetical protein
MERYYSAAEGILKLYWRVSNGDSAENSNMYYFSNIFSRENWQKPIAYQRIIIKSPKSNGDSYLDIEQFNFDKRFNYIS